MSEQSQIIEFPVPASEWQAYVDMFKESLGQAPKMTGPPPTAVFQLPTGEELHVIEVDEIKDLKPGELPFVGVNSREAVDLIYRLIREKDLLRKPYDIRVIGWQGKPVYTTLYILTYKIKIGKDLIEAEGGVIHNPPFTS
jgi:hypothetical protein